MEDFKHTSFFGAFCLFQQNLCFLVLQIFASLCNIYNWVIWDFGFFGFLLIFLAVLFHILVLFDKIASKRVYASSMLLFEKFFTAELLFGRVWLVKKFFCAWTKPTCFGDLAQHEFWVLHGFIKRSKRRVLVCADFGCFSIAPVCS